MEGQNRASLIEPSSSTIEARTALPTAPLFLTLGLGLVIITGKVSEVPKPKNTSVEFYSAFGLFPTQILIQITLHRALHDGRPGFPGADGRLPIRSRCGRVYD